MNIPQGFNEMIQKDIERLSNVSQENFEEQLRLHREIDGRYQACIKDWSASLWGVRLGHIDYRLLDYPKSIQENLMIMKAKLETYRYGMNAVFSPESNSTNVTVNTSVNVSFTFEDARQKVENMTALSRDETDEILERINELEQIAREKISRKNKWEKVKPIISFALDKGADVAIAILSLVVQMRLGA